jgi:hypothetical protein
MRSARELSLKDYMLLLHDSRCVVNPTREHLLKICPHLSDEMVERTLMRGEAVALPPLAVDTMIHVAQYFPAYTDEMEPVLCVTLVNRLGERHYPAPLFWEEAKEFAGLNWPDDLIAA